MSGRVSPTGRFGRISGLITLGWVVVWATAIAVLGSDRRAYSTFVRLSGNVVSRVLLSIVVFAVVFHTVEGLGRCVTSSQPERWRAAAWFAAWALGLPAAVVLLRPFIEGRLL